MLGLRTYTFKKIQKLTVYKCVKQTLIGLKPFSSNLQHIENCECVKGSVLAAAHKDAALLTEQGWRCCSRIYESPKSLTATMSDLQDPYSSWPFMSSSVKLILIHLCVYGTVIFHSQNRLLGELVGEPKFPCVPSKVYLQPVWVKQRLVNIEIELLRRYIQWGKV